METALNIAPLMRWKTARFFAKCLALLSPLADAAQGSGTRLSYALLLNKTKSAQNKKQPPGFYMPPLDRQGAGAA